MKKDFQLAFASILKYISIILVVIGVIGFIVSFFGTLISGMPIQINFLAIITSAIFCYALSILVHAAALYIKKNTPEPKDTQIERDEN